MKYITKVVMTLFALSAIAANKIQYPANQPQLSDYQVGEKWVWEFKGITEQDIVRAEGRDVREVINDNGVLSIKSQYGTIVIGEIVKP